MTRAKTRPAGRRLDGKKKLVLLSREMENDLRAFCADRGIESESELIRQAVAKYIYADYRDETLKLQGLADTAKKVEGLRDMVDILFRYVRLMHINLLAYSPEIDPEMADAALRSAEARHGKVFSSFQNSLKNDPPFFERLLHRFYTEDADG